MNHFKCEVCNIEMSINSKEFHEAGKKHRTKLSRKAEIDKNPIKNEQPAKIPEKSSMETEEQKILSKIVVRGYTRYTTVNDLLKVFKPFGTLKCEIFGNDFAVLKYATPDGAKMALENKVILYGAALKVAVYTPKMEKEHIKRKEIKKEQKLTKSQLKEIIVSPEEINLRSGFGNQCQAIMEAVRMTREEVESISRLYSDLTGAFQSLWPGCVAVPFGSITTGLGIKTSDADCFIDIPPNLRYYNENYVSRARKVLYKYPQHFSEVIAIPRANTPIVKFFHVPTEINCDVSFKTPLGARNSTLLAFLLRSDPRILPLCILVKYWFKVFGLTGTGKLSNYALTMLVIFYLQYNPEPILPSIKFIQQGSKYFVDCWNTGFVDRHDFLPLIKNSTELKHLFGGFFKFYKEFKFDEYVVCPFLALPINKEQFSAIDKTDDAFDLYKHNVMKEYARPLRTGTPMCVQDPFEHSHNIACSVSQKLYHELAQCIKWAADHYEKDLPDCDNYLKNILLKKPKLEKLPPNHIKINLADGILKHLGSATGWENKVKEAFKTIFEDLLMCELTKETSKTTQNTEANTESYTGVAKQCLWRNRGNTEAFKQTNIDFLTKQRNINEEMLKSDIRTEIEVNIRVKFNTSPRKVILTLKQETDPLFSIFCVHEVPLWFSEVFKLEKEQNNIKPTVNGSIGETSNDAQNISDGNNDNTDSHVANKPVSENRDIPKPKTEPDVHDSSPENPPMKMFKHN